MYTKHLIIITVAVVSCRGQLSSILFPQLSNTARGFSTALAENSLLGNYVQATGDTFANIVENIYNGPLNFARDLQLSGPRLVSDSNVRGSDDESILDNFSIGMSNEDAKMHVYDIIRKYGYSVEEHRAVTEDGYILTLFRIPGNGSAVFLMHGLLGSADDYVVAGPSSGLAYKLADEGYDVWMGNARGNKHSRRHVELNPSQAAFWDFSWHEIGVYDLPCMIDYVLNETKESSVKYIGHSQGTTSFFVMASERPMYNRKISLMVALSPVAFMSKAKSPLMKMMAPSHRLIYDITKMIGVYEFLPNSFILRTLKTLLCSTSPVSEIMCSNVLFLIAGFGFQQLNVTNLPVIYGHVPSGAATKQFAHYGQNVVSREFRKFDYGPHENYERYGSEQPPSYRLDRVDAPVSLFYSDEDWLAHPEDVDRLYNELGNAVDIHKVPYNPFNHLDFLWANDFKSLIYKRLIKLMKHF